MMRFLVLVFLFYLFLGCSDDDIEGECYMEEGRSVIRTETRLIGTVRAPSSTFCSTFFTIEPDNIDDSRPLNSFFPCNLESEFQNEGTRVIFSGLVYEIFETENVCATPFEITTIELE